MDTFLFILGCLIVMVAPDLVTLEQKWERRYWDGSWRTRSINWGFFFNFPFFCLGVYAIAVSLR